MVKDYKNDYLKWLIAQGYKEYSASGKKSTAMDYCYRVLRVKEAEQPTWKEFAANIETLTSQYGELGEKRVDGLRSHTSCRQALKNFRNKASRHD